MIRRLLVAGVLATILAAPDAPAEDLPTLLTTPGAAEAVAAELEVERTLLKEDLARHERIAAERAEIATHLQELQTSLEALLRRDVDSVPQAIEETLGRLDEAERERGRNVAADRTVLERVRERMHRVDLLEDHLAALQAKATVASGPMTGRWDVVLLPLNQRGTFSLAQNGTLVSGTYVLEGGWTGSLQGTLVSRKVFLERIDSQLGRSAEFEGYLSTDGSQVRGTWFSYDLAGKGGANGQWSAVRRPQSP